MSESSAPQQHAAAAAAASTEDLMRAVQNDVSIANGATSGASAQPPFGGSKVAVNPKMMLTPTEFARAIHLKARVLATDYIKPLTDFDIVQFAVGTYDEDLDKVLARIFITQCFQEEYNIQETVEDGIQLFSQLILNLQPGFILDLEYLPESKNFFCVKDLSGFDPSKIKTKADNKVFCGGFYYSLHAHFPDFECMRTGRSCVVECMNASLNRNFSASFVRKHANEVLKAYPCRVKESHFTNSLEVANVMMQIWRNVLPREVVDTMHFGHVIPGYEGQNLADLYQMPTAEVAREKLVSKCFQFLINRYVNRATFTLNNDSVNMELPATITQGGETNTNERTSNNQTSEGHMKK